MKDNKKVEDIKDALGECYKLSSIIKIFKIFVMFLISSFPDSIGESRESIWIFRSTRKMTTAGAEFAMNLNIQRTFYQLL
jgi:hypothetical protein